jgi:hypothetical protein
VLTENAVALIIDFERPIPAIRSCHVATTPGFPPVPPAISRAKVTSSVDAKIVLPAV